MNVTTSKKITLATVKSFIRKNSDRLHIKKISRFDGMTDGIEDVKGEEFRAVAPELISMVHPRSYGIPGAWFVGDSRDYFQPYDDVDFTGFNVWNCCGEFTIAVRK